MISAVVVNWNGEAHLPACLDALLAQQPGPDEVLLVDNASTDGSVELVGRRYPSVRVVGAGGNRGPAAARNLGLQAARGERVLLVDNDVALQPGALAAMDAVLDAAPRGAAVQARSVLAGDPQTVHYDAAALHYLGPLVLDNWFAPRAAASDPPAEVGAVVALCLLVDRAAVLGVGGFQEAHFILYEDNDLSWRLRMHGRTLHLAAGAVVHHGGGTAALSMRGAAAPYPAQRSFLHSRNRWILLLTCMHWRTLLLTLPAQGVYALVHLAFATRRGHLLAWLRGKAAVARLLPALLRDRRRLQRGRSVRDREILVARPLTPNPGIAGHGAAAALRRLLDRGFAVWWSLVRRGVG